jgi:hypothetical protein
LDVSRSHQSVLQLDAMLEPVSDERRFAKEEYVAYKDWF